MADNGNVWSRIEGWVEGFREEMGNGVATLARSALELVNEELERAALACEAQRQEADPAACQRCADAVRALKGEATGYFVRHRQHRQDGAAD